MQRALLRGLPASFAAATAAEPPDAPIQLELARRQHAAYAQALRDAGLEVLTLPADDAHPDCVFIEDTAVVVGGRALLTAPGLPSRRGEVEAVGVALAQHLEVLRAEVLSPGARLDGGDVLRVGETLYVGRSGRSDAGGARALRAAFGPLGFQVREVEVPGALHLKCVCSSPGPGVVLLAEGTVPPDTFDAEVLLIPGEEAHAANVVRAGERVLLPAGFPRARAVLEAAGYRVVALENSELRKADGSLTCCSVLF